MIDVESIQKEAEKCALPCPNIEIPKDWEIKERAYDGMLVQRWDGLTVAISDGVELDGKKWRHVSASFKTRVPNYDELKLIKSIFIGRDKKAIMVFPEEKSHVNLHRYCLHLFSCLEADPLPDFSHGLGSI